MDEIPLPGWSSRAPAVGIVLAAGAGTRYGHPKALVPGWLATACAALAGGGCAEVLVVLGARAEQVRVPDGVRVVLAHDWADGMSASLRAGLHAVRPGGAQRAVLHLVDTPDVGAEVVARLLGVPGELVRATFHGRAGHPVVLGRAHWAGVLATATGDHGARDYLRGRDDVVAVECGDLATGADVDTPPARS